eukprot:scaffold1415_cov242-Pinguiococcus_pyrenoidosus.AAC.7
MRHWPVACSLLACVSRMRPVVRPRPRLRLLASSASVGLPDASALQRSLDTERARMEQALQKLKADNVREVVAELEHDVSQEAFYQQPEAQTRSVLQRLQRLKDSLDAAENWQSLAETAEIALQLGAESQDDAFVQEAVDSVRQLQQQMDAWEVTATLDRPYDAFPARVIIIAGAGGDDAAEWANMLLKMYTRYAERRGWTCTLIDKVDAEVAGTIRSAEIEVHGDFAYGYLQSEHGTHRLVRISPYNGGNKRQTSFAGVEVSPILNEEDISVKGSFVAS